MQKRQEQNFVTAVTLLLCTRSVNLSCHSPPHRSQQLHIYVVRTLLAAVSLIFTCRSLQGLHCDIFLAHKEWIRLSNIHSFFLSSLFVDFFQFHLRCYSDVYVSLLVEEDVDAYMSLRKKIETAQMTENLLFACMPRGKTFSSLPA